MSEKTAAVMMIWIVYLIAVNELPEYSTVRFIALGVGVVGLLATVAFYRPEETKG